MTVKELIDKLKTLEQDKHIGYMDCEYGWTNDINDIAISNYPTIDGDMYCIE
jgi:hypothetical protein